MAKKKNIKGIIKMVCEKCGNIQKADPAQSTERWDILPNIPCEKCGGKYKPEVE